MKKENMEVAMRFRTRRAYQAMAADPNGRIVLADLLKFADLDRDPMVPGHPDMTAYELGKQRVARRIEAFLRMTDDEIEVLKQEEAINGTEPEAEND